MNHQAFISKPISLITGNGALIFTLAGFCFILILLFLKLKKMPIRPVCLLVLSLYTSLVLTATIIERGLYEDPTGKVWDGWVVYQTSRRRNTWNYDALYNMLMFIPLTTFLFCSFPWLAGRKWKKALITATLLSGCCSIFIETTQLFLSLGTFQLSDLVYNTISGGIGGAVYWIILHPWHH